MSTSTSQDLRCPQCDAHVRAGSDWCTLCYTDLRPAPPAPDPPTPELPVLEGPPEGETAAAEEVAPEALSRGKHARRPAAGDDLELVAESLLAELAAAEGGAPLGRLAGQVDSAGKKLALMAGGALAVTAVLFLLMVVVGALL